jgi:A/G-specific adenine glycosylase
LADWGDPGVEVRHTFTHFHLVLRLQVAAVDQDAEPLRGRFQTLTPSNLPSLMRKAYDVASSNLQLSSEQA